MRVVESSKGEKRAHLDRLLEKGTVMVIVDARMQGVRVPPVHKENAKLPLNLDYAFRIPDFRVFDDRVEASLSFNMKNFFCVLPLDSIYIMNSCSNGETVIFPEDIPRDLLSEMADSLTHPAGRDRFEGTATDLALSVVPGADDNTNPSAGAENSSKKKGQPRLRLVK